MRASPALASMNGGEFSPYMEARVDISKYPNAFKLLENFVPLIQGPITRRGGTRMLAEVKNSAHRSIGAKFEFSATQAFVLEFGDHYVRFYTDHGQLLFAGVPYEIVSPYAIADLTNADGSSALDIEQSGDVLYIANATGTYPVKTLTRLADTNWVFADYAPDNGPFEDLNTTATTLQASAATGAVTLTASANVFSSTDVGRLVRLESQDLSVQPWETNKAYLINDLARFDGKTYKALNGATSGTSPPIHEHGNAYDGKGGVQWAYQNPGYGVARISAYTDATHVTAAVIVDEDNGLNLLPADVVSTTTKRWQLGAFSATSGYPTSLTQWRSRLWLGMGIRYFGSVPLDFSNMAPDFFGLVTTDCAINRTLASADVNDIEWLCGSDELVIGTGGGEFVVGEITPNQPLGPENIKDELQTKKRTRAVKPVIAGNSLLYVQRAGRKLLAYDYRFDIDKYSANDMTALADRITRTGIIGMCYQNEPYSVIWSWLQNGKLLGFTYDKDQEVICWHRHPLGGSFAGGPAVVEWAVSTPSPDGSRDEITLQVKRTINGATKRYIEFMEKPWEGEDQDGTVGDVQADAFYVDSGLTYNGVPTTTISGLSHLEGQTVQVLVDGATHPDCVVHAGAITLSRAGSVVQAGLQCAARAVKLRLEAGGDDGTSQGRMKRVHKLIARAVDSLLGRFGMFGGRLDTAAVRSPSTAMGSPTAISSGDFDVDMPGDYDTGGMIEWRCEQPLPMTIAGIWPRMKTS
jgi:hypothetical protein